MKTSYLSTLLATLFAGSILADVPAKIDYQGRLLDSNGAALAAATSENFQVNFRIWDAQTGGNLIWGERQIVTVVNGSFSVQLGEGEPLTAGNIGGDTGPKNTDAAVPHTADALREVFNGSERFVGVTVIPNGAGAIGEIVPRLEMLAAPFAINAQNAVRASLGPESGIFETNQISVNGNPPENYANQFYVNGGATFGSAFAPVAGTHDQGALNLLVNPSGASAPPLNFFSQDGLRDFSAGVSVDANPTASDLVIYNKDSHPIAAFQQDGAFGVNTTLPRAALHVEPAPGEIEAKAILEGSLLSSVTLETTTGDHPGLCNFLYNSNTGLCGLATTDQNILMNVDTLTTTLTAQAITMNAPQTNFTGRIDFGSSLGTHINLWGGGSYGIGIQQSTLYQRSDAHFAWHRGGTHNNGIGNPGPGGALVAFLENNGTFTSGSQTTFSDRRVKRDIESLDLGLDIILDLKPSQYKYLMGGEDAEISYGFIAQEVQEVLPKLVNARDDEDKTLSLHYDGFIPVLVNAVRELKEEKDAEIAQRDAKIKSLEERLTALEAAIK